MEGSPSWAVVIAAAAAVLGTGGIGAFMSAWSARRTSLAQAAGLMTDNFIDIAAEVRSLREELDQVRDEVEECELARQVTENELLVTRSELAVVKSQLIELLEYPRNHDETT